MVKLITDQRANFVLQWLQQHQQSGIYSFWAPNRFHCTLLHHIPASHYPTSTSRMGIIQHKYNRLVQKLPVLLLLLNMWPSPSAKHMEILIRSLKVLSFIWQSNFQMHSLFILRAPHLDTLYATEALITTQFFIYFSFHLHCQWSDRAWGRVWLTCFCMEICESSETPSTMTLNQWGINKQFIGKINCHICLIKLYLLSRTLQYVKTALCTC